MPTKQPDGNGRGLLLAMMEPPPTLEAEFQDWYDTEHFPERVGTDGFLTGHRLICIDGWPRYLALYDLTDLDVLHGDGYARIAGDNYSIWTGRIVPQVWGQYRAEGVQIYPGAALLGDNGNASRIVLWRFRETPEPVGEKVVAGLRSIYEDQPETAQVRIFSYRYGDKVDYIGVVELHAPLTPAAGAVDALGEGRRHLDLVNTYVRYNRVP